MAETNEKLIADLELAYQYALDLILGTDPATAKGIREATADLQKARAAVLARMCGPGEVAISRASLATLFASYCRDKKAPVNFEVTVMPQYGADRSWIVQAWGDVHAVLRGPQ